MLCSKDKTYNLPRHQARICQGPMEISHFPNRPPTQVGTAKTLRWVRATELDRG